MKLGRWEVRAGRSRRHNFQFAGVSWMPLQTGMSLWAGIGGVFVFHLAWWRE